jgi:hypothetical protein
MLHITTIYCILKLINLLSKGKNKISIAVKISDDLVKKARSRAHVLNRSVAGQIEYWAKIGEIAEDNPDIPFFFIQDILIGLEQVKEGDVTPYIFKEGK